MIGPENLTMCKLFEINKVTILYKVGFNILLIKLTYNYLVFKQYKMMCSSQNNETFFFGLELE